MAPHTTANDVAAFTGQTFTAGQVARMAVLIPLAERWVKRSAGVDFYDVANAASDASQDWLHVVSLVVERLLAAEDPETKAAALGPYQSEKLGDYSYTLKSGTAVTAALDGDPRIAEIIARYGDGPALPGLVVNGPTRVAPTVVDTDVDISRAPWW